MAGKSESGKVRKEKQRRRGMRERKENEGMKEGMEVNTD